jgi:alpha-glucosidase
VGRAQAAVAAMLLLTLRGTPTIYYGEELGLEQVPIPPDRVQDPWEKNEPGLGLGRDPCRTPMPWDRLPQAGFTTGEPWLPLNADWPTRNVEALASAPDSMQSLYRRLIGLRREREVLRLGDYAPISAENDMLVYQRVLGPERLTIALNLSHEPRSAAIPADCNQVLLSTCTPASSQPIAGMLELAADEGVILGPVRPG